MMTKEREFGIQILLYLPETEHFLDSIVYLD